MLQNHNQWIKFLLPPASTENEPDSFKKHCTCSKSTDSHFCMLLDHWNYANHFVTWWLKGHTHQQYSNRVLLVYQVVEFSSIVHLVLPTVHSLENRWKHAKIKILKQTNIKTQPNNQPPNTRVCVIDVPETLCLNLQTLLYIWTLPICLYLLEDEFIMLACKYFISVSFGTEVLDK